MYVCKKRENTFTCHCYMCNWKCVFASAETRKSRIEEFICVVFCKFFNLIDIDLKKKEYFHCLDFMCAIEIVDLLEY